jgi:hypothetical protein
VGQEPRIAIRAPGERLASAGLDVGEPPGQAPESKQNAGSATPRHLCKNTNDNEEGRPCGPPFEEGHESKPEQDTSMSAWSWVAVGLAASLLFSVLVALVLAAILGRIGREVSELLDPELWSSAPTARERIEAEQEAPTKQPPPRARADSRPRAGRARVRGS